jgi:multiple sugar transport system permease protein
VPFVAAVFIWGGMLNPSTGWINLALQAVGVENPPAWLEDPSWVYPGLALIGVWGIGAGMIVYLAGLKGIPTDLYEAARIDGAGAWASLRHITIPMLTPVIFFTMVLSVVEVMQYFLVPLVLQDGTGEPGGSTMFYNLYLYKNFFTFQNMSYGATLAWLLFAITLAITLVLFGTARRWVYYAGEAR